MIMKEEKKVGKVGRNFLFFYFFYYYFFLYKEHLEYAYCIEKNDNKESIKKRKFLPTYPNFSDT